MQVFKNSIDTNDDYGIVLEARSDKRLTATDYIDALITDFTEFHGDRLYGDDKAVIAGVGFLGNRPVTVIGIEKGKNTEDRIFRNFGSAHPEGYRKALRLMKQAEKFKRPVICFVDTAGAFCGIDAEERGQGRAIAENLFEMSDLKTPILSVVIGEGGSGGALALCHADRIWMMEDAYFSVVSPESCANILWKDPGRAAEVAGALNLTAEKLLGLGLIDKVCRKNRMKELLSDLKEEVSLLSGMSMEDLTESRYQKFRKIGCRSY
ncbi:MAG: acetyl-CoA carboxylase carboxyl transferase subunit alpha [Lachnospiraceae bacterium]|nr:acetyl-CoA carboxylase carboxyl transferase subunit alpha [Lachnospiraceae bacterium]